MVEGLGQPEEVPGSPPHCTAGPPIFVAESPGSPIARACVRAPDLAGGFLPNHQLPASSRNIQAQILAEGGVDAAGD